MNDKRFIIDLARCTGCQACSIACKDRANLPDDIDWLKVKVEEGGVYPTPTLTYRVMHCFHCANPACAIVCPTSAIKCFENGFVQIDADLCNGCQSCVEACPFSAIVMLPTGVASKCDGCADEIALGIEPTCVRACLMRALNYTTTADAMPVNRSKDPDFDDHGIEPLVTYYHWSSD